MDNLSLLITRYFGLSGSVVVPGIGLLKRNRFSAIHQFVDKKYCPSTYKVIFDRDVIEIPVGQLEYFSRVTGFALHEIKSYLLDLGSSIASVLEKDRKVEWIGLGYFQMDEEGSLSFHSLIPSTQYFTEIPYSHVIRKNAEHAITVGSSEKTSLEMEAILEEQRKSNLWELWEKMALIFLLVSLIAIFIRFSMGHFDFFGPTYQKTTPSLPPATYRIR